LPLQSIRTLVTIFSFATMHKIIIAVGSTRKPKLNAVTEALQQFTHLFPDTEFELVGRAVETGVSHTPSSSEELMRGARQRADALIQIAAQEKQRWHYLVGLEGGLDVIQSHPTPNGSSPIELAAATTDRRVFLEGWAYVSDGTRGHFGRSGAIELPEALAHQVLDQGIELSVAVDRFAGAIGIRDNQGAWGVLSANLIARQEAFRVALVAAFAPFYNAKMYQAAAATHSHQGT
jgi:inosine/xanthosine triphosphatase